jgi:hypothetical protein
VEVEIDRHHVIVVYDASVTSFDEMKRELEKGNYPVQGQPMYLD